MALVEIYNPKQIDVLNKTIKNDWFITLLHGAKRSGKTKINNDLFLFELRRVRKIADEEDIKEPMYILAGVSSATIQKNILYRTNIKSLIQINGFLLCLLTAYRR